MSDHPIPEAGRRGSWPAVHLDELDELNALSQQLYAAEHPRSQRHADTIARAQRRREERSQRLLAVLGTALMALVVLVGMGWLA